MKSLMFFLCFLVACQPVVNSRGNVTLDEKFSKFVKGETTMDDVLRQCGTPSLHRDNYTWIYVGAKSAEESFKSIKLTNRFIVKMIFDENKVLSSIERIQLQEDDGGAPMDEDTTQLVAEKRISEKLKKRVTTP